MKRLLVAIAATALALGAGTGEAQVRAALNRVFPQGAVQSLEKTPVPGLIEAAVEGRIVYITEDGRYLLAGPLIDVMGSRNLTGDRPEVIDAIPFVACSSTSRAGSSSASWASRTGLPFTG